MGLISDHACKKTYFYFIYELNKKYLMGEGVKYSKLNAPKKSEERTLWEQRKVV